MSGKKRTIFLSSLIIMVLVFSAMKPRVVYADDSAPPDATATQVTEATQPDGGTEGSTTEVATNPPATEESAPVAEDTAPTAEPALTEAATPVPDGSTATTEPVQDPASTETAAPDGSTATTEPVQDPASTEAAAPDGSTATTEPVQDPASTEAAAPAADLSAVPENTNVTVLDSNGNAQPLATQASADAIATSDPIWCPGSQAPTPGLNGCTQSFPSFNDLLTFMSGNSTYQGDGTIYIQQGVYQGNDPNKVIDFNSPNYDLSNISNSSLTISGGWNTSNNTIDASTPTTFSNYSLLIGSSSNPWGGSLTLSNISMNLSGVANQQTTGITLYTQGDILLSNVNVSEAPNNGAELHADGNVNIENSSFVRNEHTGAVIRAGKNVNIARSTFGNPDSDTTRRQNVGLDIVSGEETSLFAVIANNGREAGATITAGGPVSIANSSFNGTMEQMLDENLNLLFHGYGLQVITTGATSDIAISNITANNNFLWGAKLDAGGNIAIADSQFNNNTTNVPVFIDDTGLFITGGQDVALTNVTANGNRLYGAQINVDGAVSIADSNFNDNRGVTTVGGVTTDYGHGLQVTTLSDIFIDNTNANNNTLFGGQLNAGGQVVISNSSFSNTSTNPTSTAIVGKGLEITSGGDTSLANVVLNNNQTDGADIQAGGDVFLDLVTATDNGTDGVLVQGTCAHVNGGQYSGNGQYGLNLGNTALDLVSPPVFATNGAGNIFPDTPISCAPPVSEPEPPVVIPETPTVPVSEPPVINPGTPNGGTVSVNEGSSNLFAGNLTSTNAGMASGNISLISFLANSTTGSNSLGIFIGKYAYVETRDGLQILAIDPDSLQVAMVVP